MQTLQLEGVKYVLIKKAEYDRLSESELIAESKAPPFADAIETVRNLLAERLKTALDKAGWSQSEAAAKAKVRPETISRIMSRKHTVGVAIWDKLDRAFRKAGVTM